MKTSRMTLEGKQIHTHSGQWPCGQGQVGGGEGCRFGQFLRWSVTVGVFLLAVWVSPSTAYVVHPGRHVCMTRHQTNVPTKTMQTYCKPVYKKHVRMCENSPYRLCTSIRVLYQLAYREMYKPQPQTRLVYSCCAGWSPHKGSTSSCLKPVCRRVCHNDGVCTKPNVCQCRKGWTGPSCNTDMDECSAGVHKCSQRCTNVAGSYRCSCRDGYVLSADGRSCHVCLTCSPEYRDLTDGYQELARRVLKLERENTELREAISEIGRATRNNMRKLRDDVRVMMDDMHATPVETTEKMVTEPAPVTPSGEKKTSGSSMLVDRLQSLSRQVAFLEERLGFCHCDNR